MCTPPFFFEDYAARALLSHPVSELPERTRPLAQRTLPHQHLPRPPVLPRHLFPHAGENGVAKNSRRKPPHNFQAGRRSPLRPPNKAKEIPMSQTRMKMWRQQLDVRTADIDDRNS